MGWGDHPNCRLGVKLARRWCDVNVCSPPKRLLRSGDALDHYSHAAAGEAVLVRKRQSAIWSSSEFKVFEEDGRQRIMALGHSLDDREVVVTGGFKITH